MKIFLFISLLISLNLYANLNEQSTNAILPRPVDVSVDFDEAMLNTAWIKEFHYVIVVNKANTGKDAQTINVYEFGTKIISGKVSTGRDEFEAKGEHNSKRDSWSVTPTGYYTPQFLDKDHRSSAYGGIFSKILGGVKMPFSIFFNGDIALHQAPSGTEGQLGKKASGGCVRLPQNIAEDLFYRVEQVASTRIPKFNVDGTITTNEKGEYAYREKLGYSALIIVINKVN